MTSWEEILKKLNDYARDDAFQGINFNQLQHIYSSLIENGFKINFLSEGQAKGMSLEKREGFYLSILGPETRICGRIDTIENVQELQEIFDQAISWLETARTTEGWFDGSF